MNRLVLNVVLLLSTLQFALAADVCIFSYNGKQYSFQSASYSTNDQGGAKYTWNPCNPTLCGGTSQTGACQLDGNQAYNSLGTFPGTLAGSGGGAAFQISYTGGTGGRNSQVQFTCGTGNTLIYVSEAPQLEYNLNFVSECACANPPSSCSSGPTPPPPAIQCSVALSNGTVIDLTPLESQTDYTFQNSTQGVPLVIYMNVCKAIQFSGGPCVNGTGFCETFKGTQALINYGFANYTIQYDPFTQHAFLTTTGGSTYCVGQTLYSASIEFICDPNAGAGYPLLSQTECDLYFSWRSQYACAR